MQCIKLQNDACSPVQVLVVVIRTRFRMESTYQKENSLSIIINEAGGYHADPQERKRLLLRSDDVSGLVAAVHTSPLREEPSDLAGRKRFGCEQFLRLESALGQALLMVVA